MHNVIEIILRFPINIDRYIDKCFKVTSVQESFGGTKYTRVVLEYDLEKYKNCDVCIVKLESFHPEYIRNIFKQYKKLDIVDYRHAYCITDHYLCIIYKK